jgi:DNA-binding transcriptional MerR regulator
MRISEVAHGAGVTTKTVRYYESVGLVSASRLPNGYRDYDESDVRLVREIHALGALGIRAEQSRPFLDCLVSGHERADDCSAAIGAYRAAIDELDSRIAELSSRRTAIAELLATASIRSAESAEPRCEFEFETVD